MQALYDDLNLPSLPVLSPQDERNYLELIHLGCGDGQHVADHHCWYREQFVLRNMRLVLSCARRFIPSDRDERFADVVSAGIIGLLTGIDRFDVHMVRGGAPMRFSTYGVWWIQSMIREELGRTDLRVIRHKSYHQQFTVARRELEILSGRAVDDDRLVFDYLRRCCGWSAEKCERLRSDQHHRVVALSGGGDRDGDEPASDLTPASDEPGPLSQLLATEANGLLHDAMRRLDFAEIYILLRHYASGDSHQDIAADLGLSRERVRQRENEALRKLWADLSGRLGD